MFDNVVELPRQPTEEDGLNVYLIVNTDLNMGVGKVGGQCGHAIQYLMQLKQDYNDLEENGDLSNFPITNSSDFYSRMYDWLDSTNHAKIVLGANGKEFEKIKLEYNPIVVKDAGKTQIEAGSETVICLYPMFKDERTKTLKRLQLLK